MKPEITTLPAKFHTWLDSALADDIWQAHCNNNEPALEAAVASIIDAAIAAEREACAKLIDPPKSEPSTPEARLARTVREMLAAAIRARGKS